MQSLLKTADQLKIKGLCESEEKENSTSPLFIPRVHSKTSKVASPKHYRKLDNNKRYKFREFDEDNLSETEEDIKDGIIPENASDDDSDAPLVVDEGPKRKKVTQAQTKPLNMSSHGLLAEQVSIVDSIKAHLPTVFFYF